MRGLTGHDLSNFKGQFSIFSSLVDNTSFLVDHDDKDTKGTKPGTVKSIQKAPPATSQG